MDQKAFITFAKAIVCECTDADISEKDVYVVWYCKTLQNQKALLGTPVHDGKYFEVTYNGDKEQIYFDEYVKSKNVCYEVSNLK